jgi:hypothetical protein
LTFPRTETLRCRSRIIGPVAPRIGAPRRRPREPGSNGARPRGSVAAEFSAPKRSSVRPQPIAAPSSWQRFCSRRMANDTCRPPPCQRPKSTRRCLGTAAVTAATEASSVLDWIRGLSDWIVRAAVPVSRLLARRAGQCMDGDHQATNSTMVMDVDVRLILTVSNNVYSNDTKVTPLCWIKLGHGSRTENGLRNPTVGRTVIQTGTQYSKAASFFALHDGDDGRDSFGRLLCLARKGGTTPPPSDSPPEQAKAPIAACKQLRERKRRACKLQGRVAEREDPA